VPFEYDATKRLWGGDGGVPTWLLGQNPDEWTCLAHRRCVVPKNRFGLRISTQLDPLDTLMYTALVYALGRAIEKKRLPVKKGIVHSYHFKPEAGGGFYDPQYGWESFRQHTLEAIRSDQYGAVVLADIADFFPRVYSHPLKNALTECTVRKAWCVRAIKGL
jgi:hypothetical protein